jgi:hypothetical protein
MGFLSDIFKVAAGAALGNSGTRKELRKQTQLMEEQAHRADNERYHERSRNNYMRDQIIRENQERRRKGLPELPVPPGDYRI